MRVLHLAAGNRWTGAAAPAFAEVEALREAGVDAHYAYVGGYKLEAKIGHLDFAHGAIEKAQNPVAFFRTVQQLAGLGRFNIVHAHLTYDHWIGRFVANRTGAKLVRTFHSRRVLRSDPFTRLLVRGTSAILVINDRFADAPLVRDRNPVFTPPPVDHRQFRPDGPNVRAAYGIGDGVPLLAVIGKLSRDRGFELALQSLVETKRRVPDARLMIIGHGEHRPFLEALASKLGIADSVIWAGYHEVDLAEHYRAANALLFTARGSDEGHRAVLEAMACGVPPVTAPIEGMAALLGTLGGELIADEATAAAIGTRAATILSGGMERLSRAVAEMSGSFSYSESARRLLASYGAILRSSGAKQA